MRKLYRRRQNPNAAINVTPLIDVLLVLIVIFMVITPMAPKGFESNIPAPPLQKQQVKPENVLVLSVTDDGGIRLNRESVEPGTLTGRLSEVFRTRADRTIYVQAEDDVMFDKVVQVIDVARGSGAGRIGLLTMSAASK